MTKVPPQTKSAKPKSASPKAFGKKPGLFQKNMAFFKKKRWAFIETVNQDYTPSAKPVIQGQKWQASESKMLSFEELDALKKPIINLDIGERLLYEKNCDQDGRIYSKKQVTAICKKPKRLSIGDPSADQIAFRSNRGFQIILDEGKARTKAKPKTNHFEDEIMSCYGVGLGFHIQPLIEKLNLRILLITEPYLDFLYYSCFQIDWEIIDGLMGARHGLFEIIAHSNTNLIQHRYVQRLRELALNQIDGLILYDHYPSTKIYEIHQHLLGNLSYALSNMGFFEDELVMISNSIQNFTYANPAYYWNQKRHLEKKMPAVIVGSGPSLMKDIETLRAVKDKVVIFASGSAIATLLKYDIRPDFLTLLENTLNQVDVIQSVAKNYDLSDITLIASSTVYYKVAEYFPKRIFFMRDMISMEAVTRSKIKAIDTAGPTVTNLSARFAAGTGFRDVYLLGVDFGSRDAAVKHAPNIFYDDTELGQSYEKVTTTQFDVKANFCGKVTTTHVLNFACSFMENLTVRYGSTQFYNCSDGAYIEGFIPKLFAVAAVGFEAHDKTRMIETIYKNLDQIDDAKDHFLVSVTQLRRHAKRHITQIIDKIEKLERYGQLANLLYREFYLDTGKDSLDCMLRTFRGTLFIYLSAVHTLKRRMARKDFDNMLPWIKAFYIHELNDMLRIYDELLALIETDSLKDVEANAHRNAGTLYPIVKNHPYRVEGTHIKIEDYKWYKSLEIDETAS